MSDPVRLSASLSPNVPQAPISERALLFTLGGIQFTNIVDFMVVMPLGPQFTQLFDITDAQFGWLVSAYTLAAGASGLLASAFVDRFERKRLLLWLYLGFALATLGCGLSVGYGMLMATRIAAGLFGGVMTTLVQTIIGDAIPFERRGRAMGFVMAAFSMATVAGVPGSLWIAERYGWHTTFILIAMLCLTVGAVGMRSLPRLDRHLHSQHAGMFGALGSVLRTPNHWRAFAFTFVTMSASFTVIPYLTIFLTANAGVAQSQIPLIYLAGGIATFFSARLIGAAADRWGKVMTFRAVAVAAMLPVIVTTNLSDAPLWLTLVATTLFFVFVSGRMVPAGALLTQAAEPRMRGAFMSLNGSVQSAALALASLLGGYLISRDAAGLVVGYERTGWVMVALSLVSVWLVGRLRLHTVPAAVAASAATDARPG